MNTAEQATIVRLREILEQIKSLNYEALEVVSQIASDPMITERARRYWYAQIEMALDDEHGWLGGSSGTLESTIEELLEGES